MKHYFNEPKKPYKNLAHARQCMCEASCSDKLKDNTWWPCFSCKGLGKVTNYNVEHHDPVEGWRNAPKNKCDTCNSMGSVSRKEFNDMYYKPALNRWKEECKKVRNKNKKITSILKKITPEEKEIINNLIR